MLQRLPKLTKNFYFITSVLFISWMMFFDSNDLYSQFVLKSKLKDLEEQKAYYLEKIEEVKVERDALLNDKTLLEKFAREKYYMNKEGEDVFVVVEKKTK